MNIIVLVAHGLHYLDVLGGTCACCSSYDANCSVVHLSVNRTTVITVYAHFEHNLFYLHTDLGNLPMF